MRKHKACQPLSPFDTPLIFTWYRLDTPMIVTHHFQQHIHEFKCVWRYNICFWCRSCTAYIYSIPTWNSNESDAILSTTYIQIQMRMKIHFMLLMPFLGSKYLHYTNFKLQSKWTTALYRTYKYHQWRHSWTAEINDKNCVKFTPFYKVYNPI